MDKQAIIAKLEALGYKPVGSGQPELNELVADLENLPVADLELQEPWNLCIVFSRPLTATEAWNLSFQLGSAGDSCYMEGINGQPPYAIIAWEMA